MDFEGFPINEINQTPLEIPQKKPDVLTEKKETSFSLAKNLANSIKEGGDIWFEECLEKFEKIIDPNEKEQILVELTTELKDWDIVKQLLYRHYSFTDAHATKKDFINIQNLAKFFAKYNFINQEDKEKIIANSEQSWKNFWEISKS